MPKPKSKKFILWFKDISIKDVPLVGGKNASLGEMYNKLTKKGINIPDGFAITAYAYQYFLEKEGLKKEIKEVLKELNSYNVEDLKRRGEKIRNLILKAELPEELKKEIVKAYRRLSKTYQVKEVDVAARSSATSEDLPTASFAGQMESYLNISGEEKLLESVKKCFASLFTNRAISYREDMGFKHLKVFLSVGIQKMVRADKGSSGVMFTIDTDSGFPNVILINSIWGLGENVVKGRVNPDEYLVFKPTLRKGFKAIISKKLGDKKLKLIYKHSAINTPESIININVPYRDQIKHSLADEEILTLAKWGSLIEDHYKIPMDIEWAKDGIDGKLYIVQARPETVHATKEQNILEEYILKQHGEVLTTGLSIGNKIGQGKVRVIKDLSGIKNFYQGEVLVTGMTSPDWEPIMKKAAGIVTDSGSRTCHAAIVSRELGVPCIVGTVNSTKVLKTGEEVTISCVEGERGIVYRSLLPFQIKKTNLKSFKRPKTKIMMNIGEPGQAFILSFIPNDGVGLAREEFIINNYIKIHPLALLETKKLKNLKTKKLIKELTYGYKNKRKFFVDKLAEGIGQIVAAFYPKEVIVRFSDFKSNEYAHLIGGGEFEIVEANPMLGFRGASRYYDPRFKAAFNLECQAIKKVREEFGLDNVICMIPFCRTPEEGIRVLKVMEKNGLKRQKAISNKQKAGSSKPNTQSLMPNALNIKPLQVYVMIEIPSNVILAEKFAKIFDGFSIGSNDLTQLTLGLDRDSELVGHIGDERNEAVKRLIAQVIKIAKKNKVKIGICGQAPSDFPDFTKFLIEQGIDSISLNPDSVIKTTLKVLEVEKRLRKRKSKKRDI